MYEDVDLNKNLKCFSTESLSEIREKFKFPFSPYPQQAQLMEAIYQTLNEGSVGVFESPTGTGKSLSILCGALRWLKDEEDRVHDVLTEQLKKNEIKENSSKPVSTEPDWLSSYLSPSSSVKTSSSSSSSEEMVKAKDYYNLIAGKINQSLSEFESNIIETQTCNKRKMTLSSELLHNSKKKKEILETNSLSSTSLLLNSNEKSLKSQSDESESESESEEEDEFILSKKKFQKFLRNKKNKINFYEDKAFNALPHPRIIYCSRTHSQITQFLEELNKTKWKSLEEKLEAKKNNLDMKKTAVRTLVLASRKHLCVNPTVNSLKTETGMNEKCLDMKKKNGIKDAEGKKTSCVYHNIKKEKKLSQYTLSKLVDIEDLLMISREEKICPYYSSRYSLPYAQLICTPYSSLIHSEIREIMGLSVNPFEDSSLNKDIFFDSNSSSVYNKKKNTVIIFDEAHNLTEAINNVYSVTLSLPLLNQAFNAVNTYLETYQHRLGTGSHFYTKNKSSIDASTISSTPNTTTFSLLASSSIGSTTLESDSGGSYYYLNLLLSVIKHLITLTENFSKKDSSKHLPKPSMADFFKMKKLEKEKNLATNSVNNQDSQTNSSLKSSSVPTTTNCSDSSTNKEDPISSCETLTVNSFLFKSKLDHINFFKLRNFILQTQIINKISGFYDNFIQKKNENNENFFSLTENKNWANSYDHVYEDEKKNESKNISTRGSLHTISSFLFSLTAAEEEGRIFLMKNYDVDESETFSNDTSSKDTVIIKFELINPSRYFSTLVKEARSVVLVGGTLKPFSSVKSSLFSNTSIETPEKTKLNFLSCDHIVNSSQITYHIVSQGEVNGSSTPFTFTHQHKNSVDLVNSLGKSLIKLLKSIPDGVVIFFASYKYLEYVVSVWKKSDLYKDLEDVKHIFVEKRKKSPSSSSSSSSSSLEVKLNSYQSKKKDEESSLWNQYNTTVNQAKVKKNKSACLFSVINGNLSEGINFSDELARAVIIVGLPYPDTRNPILKEKIKFHNLSQQVTFSDKTDNYISLPESLCMKAVNQAIGRAIRHFRDYAAVILIDSRYEQDTLRNQLPSWITRNKEKKVNETLDQTILSLKDFYRKNNNK